MANNTSSTTPLIDSPAVTEVISYHFGRAGELKRLNNERNSLTLSKGRRLQADKAHTKIMNQIKDKHLMGMRERLIRAARAGDRAEMAKISSQMKDYLGEDVEAGY